MHIIYKMTYLLIMKTSILVGGQAVIEGVMMRVPGAYATALRLKNGRIISKRYNFVSIIEKHKLKNHYVIRGMFHLYESMQIGYKTLEWSASTYEKDSYGKNKKQPTTNKGIEYLINMLSIAFGLSLFILLPLFLATFIIGDSSNKPFYFNIISGIIRIIIFLTYLLLISQLKDVYKLFQYHGAEHKTVYNFESGKTLHYSEAQKFSRKHPRCGTSFIFIIMLVTIFSYAIFDTIALFFINNLTIFLRFTMHIILLPLVAGIGYEVLKFLAKRQHIKICSLLSKPGLWLQNITTKPPKKEHIEVAIYALKEAFGKDITHYTGKEYRADSIG